MNILRVGDRKPALLENVAYRPWFALEIFEHLSVATGNVLLITRFMPQLIEWRSVSHTSHTRRHIRLSLYQSLGSTPRFINPISSTYPFHRTLLIVTDYLHGLSDYFTVVVA